ncbi:GGDEF domain-containing protein [Olsenella uli]|uniref:GGDEF domain-containing protein n=1 Tax=Olsenella uli TaxID=133926 RepID=UPI003D7BE6EA
MPGRVAFRQGPRRRRRLRSAFEIRVDELWGAGEHFTLAFIDLDNLKTCNDRFGHKRGNAYIQQTAFFIENSLTPGEQLFRLGGDEFVLISTTGGVHELEERLESVRTQLSRATAVNGAMPFSFSFGCARVRPGKGDSRSHMTAACTATRSSTASRPRCASPTRARRARATTTRSSSLSGSSTRSR